MKTVTTIHTDAQVSYQALKLNQQLLQDLALHLKKHYNLHSSCWVLLNQVLTQNLCALSLVSPRSDLAQEQLKDLVKELQQLNVRGEIVVLKDAERSNRLVV